MFRKPLLFLSFCALLSSLAIAELELPEIEVRAKRPQKPLGAEPEGSSETHHNTIPLQKRSSVENAIQQEIAIDVKPSVGENSPTTISIRGLDPIQNRTFLNDVPLNDSEFQSDVLHWIPAEALSELRVFPNSVPVNSGADGLGGAFQMQLRRPGSPTQFGSRYGSYDYFRLFADIPLEERIQVFGDYRQSKENFTFLDDNGTPLNPADDTMQTRLNNDFRRATLIPRWSLFDSKSARLEGFDLHVYAEQKIPGPIAAPQPSELKQHYHLVGLHYGRKWAERWSLDSVLSAKYSSDKLDSQSVSLVNPTSKASTWGVQTNQRVRYYFGGGNYSEMSLGVGFESYQNLTLSAQGAEQTHRRLSVPVGFHTKIALNENWNFYPAFISHFLNYQGQSTKNYLLVSPRLSTDYQLLSWLKVRGEVGSFYRAPSQYELNGSVLGISANPNLSVEKAIKAEVGAEAKWSQPFAGAEAMALGYTYSHIRAKDLITYLQNSQYTRIATNVGESRIHAHEVNGKVVFDFVPVSIRSGMGLLWTENLSALDFAVGKELPNRPPYRFFVGLDYSDSLVDVSYSYRLTGPLYWDLANLKRMDSVSDHSVRFAVKPKGWGVFSFEVQNLLNTTTSTSHFDSFSWTDNTTGIFGFPSPGRRFFVAWNLSL